MPTVCFIQNIGFGAEHVGDVIRGGTGKGKAVFLDVMNGT